MAVPPGSSPVVLMTAVPPFELVSVMTPAEKRLLRLDELETKVAPEDLTPNETNSASARQTRASIARGQFFLLCCRCVVISGSVLASVRSCVGGQAPVNGPCRSRGLPPRHTLVADQCWTAVQSNSAVVELPW